jgi:hypothetical protein
MFILLLLFISNYLLVFISNYLLVFISMGVQIYIFYFPAALSSTATLL